MSLSLETQDELGPCKVVVVRDPLVGLEAFVVIDNTAAGPAIGGLRMSQSVTVNEVARLARAMTLKSAAAGLPHGGAKAGIVSSAKIGDDDKERLVRAFARAIASESNYIPGPDLGTDERCMAFVHDETKRAVGLPRVLGGIPLDTIGATAHGLAVCAEVAQGYAGVKLKGAAVAVQGFGSVGLNVAAFLAQKGAVIVAAADSGGAITNPEGLDINALIKHKKNGQSVHRFSGGKAIGNDELIGVGCDIWIPAAQADVINRSNQARLKAKLVLCGANIPITDDAERALHERGVLVVPDFIANAGGLICASIEYRGGSERDALASIEDAIARNTTELLERASAERQRPRIAATHLAEARVREAMSYRSRGGRGIKANVLDL